jgi:hypothetical protein
MWDQVSAPVSREAAQERSPPVQAVGKTLEIEQSPEGAKE